MRLRTDLHLCTVVTLALMSVLPARAEPVQQASTQANAGRPDQAEIERAIAIVKADPNLATERTIKTLRWRDSATTRTRPAWLTWLADLFRWLDHSARLLMWCAAAMLAGLLVVSIARVVRARGLPYREEPFVAPTHVRDLDIRPESLPADVGAAARGLWDRGEHRASLALLYRGLLSRLAHVHRMPIGDSTTEGDCLALSATHLPPRRCEYASLLIGVWQRSVYGREDVRAATVYALCADFASMLDAREAA